MSKNSPTKYALLVGLNYYHTQYELHGCVNDVLDMKKFIAEKRGYKEENITLLTDRITDNTLPPTKANILGAIGRLVSQLTKGDTLFIHISSHGGQSPDKDHDEHAHRVQDGVIFAASFEEIYDEELRKQLVDKIPEGVKLRCFFDCCHSATDLDLPYVYVKPDRYHKDSNPCLSGQSDDCLMISGCKDSGTSDDAVIGGRPNGALTHALLKTLTWQEDLPWRDILTIVRHELKAEGHNQIPQLSVGRRALTKQTFDV